MGKNRTSCFLCGFDKNQNAFYKFPQDESRRLQWATAVGASLNELPTYSKLCKNHFVEDDFHTPNFINENTKIRLRQSAVPSLLLEMRRRPRRQLHPIPSTCENTTTTKRRRVQNPNESNENTANFNSQNSTATRNTVNEKTDTVDVLDHLWMEGIKTYSFWSEVLEKITTTNEKPILNRKVSNENTANCNSENSTSTGNTVNENTDTVDSSVNWGMERPSTRYSSFNEQLSISVKSNSEQNSQCEPKVIPTSTPKSHKVHAMRHVEDIRTPNLSTLKKAHSNVQFMKNTIAKLKHEKKMLLQKVRRAVKKIKTLNELMGQLKRSNLVSEGLNTHTSALSKLHFLDH